MIVPGDMFPVASPDDTGPRHAPLGSDWRYGMDGKDEGTWVAAKDYYADVDGHLVEAGDPAAQTVVAAKGYTYPLSVAAAYGIITDVGAGADAEDAQGDAHEPQDDAGASHRKPAHRRK